jgi:hypothetical protein
MPRDGAIIFRDLAGGDTKRSHAQERRPYEG